MVSQLDVVTVGQIERPFGVKGEVKVRSLSDVPGRLEALTRVSLVAKGGRVLAVTAVADTFANARARAYRAVDQIDFADGFHRRDIGWRELARENA